MYHVLIRHTVKTPHSITSNTVKLTPDLMKSAIQDYRRLDTSPSNVWPGLQ